ncbi:MAG TPA: hypothetical protein VKF35_05235 [Hyphomicrobiaceae bacterium]|nr:hypothetical protein [Hyphomicrobiaceae bacterium]
MTSTPTIDHSDPTHLVAIARADRSRLSGERRLALDELLAGAEPPYDRDPARWDAAIFLPINARVAANAFARTACWGEAWRVMVSAVAEPSEPGQAAELRLLEILLDVMHRGVEAAAARMIDGVEPLIGAGHRYARLSLLDRLHQLLLMTGRTDDSLRLLRLDRIAPWEQLSGVASLLTYARPEVVTITGEDQLVVGADRMRPYADAIAELWHRLPAIDRQQTAAARGLVVWALAMTGGDIAEAIQSFGPDDGLVVEQLCRWLSWFGLAGVRRRIADAMQPFDCARTPSPGYLVAVQGRIEDAIDMFLVADDWALAHRLLTAIRNVPQGHLPRLVVAIDRMIDVQVADPELSLDGPHHTAITLPALLRRRALLTRQVRPLPAAAPMVEPQLAAAQAAELIALALATTEVAVAACHYANLAETERHDLMFAWGRDHCDVPRAPLRRMLAGLSDPGLRALGIGHYVAGLAQRRLILAPLL